MTEAGTFFGMALWSEFLKGLALNRKDMVDRLETTRLDKPDRVYDIVRIQGQLEGLDKSLRILEKIIGMGNLPGVTKAEFPRL